MLRRLGRGVLGSWVLWLVGVALWELSDIRATKGPLNRTIELIRRHVDLLDRFAFPRGVHVRHSQIGDTTVGEFFVDGRRWRRIRWRSML